MTSKQIKKEEKYVRTLEDKVKRWQKVSEDLLRGRMHKLPWKQIVKGIIYKILRKP